VSPETIIPSGKGGKAALMRNLRLSTADGVAATPIVTMSLPVNLFLTALVTETFRLPTSAIGLFTAVPFIANFLHIFAMPILARWKQPKTLTVIAATLHLATWLALGVMLPWLPRGDPARAGRWLIAWFFISSLFGAIMGVSWNSWIQEWVPPRLRGKYFGRRNRLLQIAALLFLLGAGWTVGRWHYAIPAFQAIIAGAGLLRLFSLRWQWISPTRPLRPAEGAGLSVRAQLGILRKSGSLLAFIAFGCVWSFAANCFGAFYQVFMFDQAHLSAFGVGVTATLSQLGGALSMPAWGLLLDRYGNKPVMIVSLLLWQISNFFWCFVTPANQFLLYGLWMWAGATSAGFVLGQFTILLRLLPVEAKNLAIGFNLAVTSLFAAVAPIAGGCVLERALGRSGDALAVYHACFLVQPVLALGGAFLLFRVHEPAASPLSVVVGAMRNIRTLGGVLGLSFLTNYVFVKRKPALASPRGRP
jgi:MFS family permease